MKRRIVIKSFILAAVALISQSCIHDHPIGDGENPSRVNAELEIAFDLSWGQILHQVDFEVADTETKAGEEKRHKFIIETSRNGSVYSKEEVYLSDEEFNMGFMHHQFSKAFSTENYDLVVWYERTVPENNISFFNTENLDNVTLLTSSVSHLDSIQCAHASETLDLSTYSNSRSSEEIVKQVELEHSGAKFQIVTTDINEFIEENRAYLLQGDSFFVNLSFSEDRHSSINLYNNRPISKGETLERKGELWLPFAEYTELKIADGFIFTESEEMVTMTLTITNTTGMTVSQTQPFSFPVKRGTITTIRGNFLSFPINGFLGVDPVWDGEIEIEI